MLLTVPFLSFLTGLFAGYLPFVRGQVLTGRALIAGATVCTAWVVWQDQTAPGLDGVIYSLMLWAMVLPGLVGGVLGSLVGVLRCPRGVTC
jgi:hypothetical protein